MRLAAFAGMLCRQEFRPDAADDACGDFVLNGEDVAEVAVVPLGPEMGFGGRIDELRGHPDVVAGLADTPLENIADPEFAPDGAHIHGLSLVGEHRVAGDHEEALELG